jgi:type VI protein secretion system component Hcp
MRNSLTLLIGSALAVIAAFWFVSVADAAKKRSDKPSVSDINVTKYSDKSSPTMMQRSTTPKIKGESTQIKNR